MSKVSKLKAILIMALSAVMMFSASLFMMNNNAQPVSAEEEAVFEMVTDVQARLDVPAGLRFKATFNDAAKAEIDESVMFGFAIAPKSYFDATNGDYNSLEDGVIAELDKTQLVKVGDKYVISGVLYNIKEQNWDLDFSAVAFYAKEGGEMFFATGELPVGNINDLIIDQYWDGNEEAREQLLNTFNYGGTEDLVIEDNEFVGSYTIPAHPIGISTADQFVSAIAEEGKEFKMVNDVTITNDVLGGSITISGKLASDFKAVIDGNGKNLTVNADADGYFSGLFTNFTGTLKNANLILWIKAPMNGQHANGALTNYFDGVIDGCTINYTFENGGGGYGYGYASLLGTMGENAILQNTIINAKDLYHEGGIIAEYAADSCSQIINVAVVSNQLHSPRCYLGKLLPHEYVNIDGLYVTDKLDDLVAGKADYVFDNDKYDMYDGDSYQYPYGTTGYGTDVFYNDNASITIADILGREVERVSAPVKTSSGGAMMDALAGALNPALVEITMNDELIAITQGDEPVALNVTATYDGVAVDPSLLSWTSSDPSVVSVSAGKITAVGEGQAYVYASYLGVMSAGCLVDVEGLWYEITDEASFIEAMQGNFSYRLTQDLVLTDKFIDTTSTYGGSVFTSDFYGTLDGAGHTVTFNADTTGQTYFNGAFRFIYGAVKNTNFVVNMKSPVNSTGTSRGVFAYRVYGTVENCIVNVQVTKTAGDYGYWSVFGELGENAVINNVVVKAVSSYMAGGAIAKVVQPTSKVSNFVLISNNLGWADMTLGSTLPQEGKCVIENFYVYDNIVPSSYNLKLDTEKYYADGAPQNITWTTSNCADSNIDVLYSRPANVAIADIVGFDVEAYDAPILTLGEEAPVEATLASLRFATAE